MKWFDYEVSAVQGIQTRDAAFIMKAARLLFESFQETFTREGNDLCVTFTSQGLRPRS